MAAAGSIGGECVLQMGAGRSRACGCRCRATVVLEGGPSSDHPAVLCGLRDGQVSPQVGMTMGVGYGSASGLLPAVLKVPVLSWL